MYTRDLKNVLKSVPIILKNRIMWKCEDGYYEAEAIALRNNKTKSRYTIMNYNCDNLTQTLLHESLHHCRPKATEKEIEQFTDFLWRRLEHRKMFQDKIVKVLGDYDL